MHIFVSGGTGFVGRALCRELTDRGHKLSCLIRPGSQGRLLESELITPVAADLFDTTQLTAQITGCDGVIHLVGIIREFPTKGISFKRLHLDATTSITKATQEAGVHRYLHMSANGTRDHAISTYHQTKWQAEEVVRQSGLDWTIFRPSLIYGGEDQFINMLSGLVRKSPLVPVMGSGEYRMQPIPVESIATSFANALELPIAIGKTYHCGGADCLSYNRLLDEVGFALGKKRVSKLSLPLALMRPLVRLLQHFPPFPMTADQLQMLLEGNCCETDEWRKDLRLEPVTFRQGLKYLER